MAISKRVVLGKIEVLEDGQLQVRTDTVVEEDGVELSRTFHRGILEPVDPVTRTYPSPLTAQIATIVWTPAVVAEYKRKKRLAEEAPIKVGVESGNIGQAKTVPGDES